MKRIIRNFILFLVSIVFFSCVYIFVFKVPLTAVFVLLIVFVIYGFLMGLGEKSIKELKIYEQRLIHFGLNKKDELKILLFSIAALSPMFGCIMLVASVPLYTNAVWFITVFPCIILNCIPASSILDEYHCLTRRKAPFLISFLSITLVCCIIGMLVGSVVLKVN